MVDTIKRNDRESLLAKRVERLTAELDQLENAHAKYWNVIRKSVGVLSSLAQTKPGGPIEKAVMELKKASAQKRGNLKTVTAKVDALQSALMADSPQKGQAPNSQPVETPKASPEARPETETALLAAISALASLAPRNPESGLWQAVDRLKLLVQEKNIRPQAVKEASHLIKTQLLSHEEAVQKNKQPALDVELKSDAPKALLGWRLASRLLNGMYLEDEAFDADLAKVENAVKSFLNSGELDKPALAMAADLMENLRSILDRRHQDAQNALLEIVKELVKTEAELAGTVDSHGKEIISGGQLLQSDISSRLAALVKEVNQAQDMDSMKSQVLGHVHAMRDNLAQRIASQRSLVDATAQRMAQLKQVVSQANQRIKLAEEKSRRWGREAMTDNLTGVWNRRALDMMLMRGQEKFKQGMCLLILDVDQFRGLVNEWGVEAADQALVTIARELKQCIRESDYLFRYEADHFAALLQGRDLTRGGAVAECMRSRIQEIHFSQKGLDPMRLTATVVAATHRQDEAPADLWARTREVLKEVRLKGHSNKALTTL